MVLSVDYLQFQLAKQNILLHIYTAVVARSSQHAELLLFHDLRRTLRFMNTIPHDSDQICRKGRCVGARKQIFYLSAALYEPILCPTILQNLLLPLGFRRRIAQIPKCICPSLANIIHHFISCFSLDPMSQQIFHHIFSARNNLFRCHCSCSQKAFCIVYPSSRSILHQKGPRQICKTL